MARDFDVFIDMAGAGVNVRAVDSEDIFSGRPDDPLTLLKRQDLDPLSVNELNARISLLEAEIARTRRKIEASVNHRSTADSLFKR